MINIAPAKTGFQNIVDLIVANNGGVAFSHTLDESNITLGATSAYDDAANENANTQITVTAVLDAGFSGTRDITYYRPTLAEAATTPGSQIEVVTAGADSDQAAYEVRVKNAIAAALLLRLEDFELTDAGTVEIPENENNPVTVTIQPVAGSYLYFGATMDVLVAAVDTDIPLEDVIVTQHLAGFTF